MKVLPTTLSISKNNYSYNNARKNNFADNVTFSAGAQIIKADAIKMIDINNIMEKSNSLGEKFEELIQIEKVLREHINDMLLPMLTARIGNILHDNGFSPQHFITHGNFRGVTVREPKHFFELFEKLGGETVRVSRPGWSASSGFQAVPADNPDDELTHVEHRLKLKGEYCPDASLEIYAAKARNGDNNIIKNNYILDINSYTDKEFSLTSDEHHCFSSGSNLFTLNTSDIETDCHFRDWDFELYPTICFSIVDKKNNVTYNHTNYRLGEIKSGNDNTTYDLFSKTITQKFSDKVVVHHLSKDLGNTESIEFRKAEKRK